MKSTVHYKTSYSWIRAGILENLQAENDRDAQNILAMGLRDTIETEKDFENSYSEKINRRKDDCWRLDSMSLLNTFSGQC